MGQASRQNPQRMQGPYTWASTSARVKKRMPGVVLVIGTFRSEMANPIIGPPTTTLRRSSVTPPRYWTISEIWDPILTHILAGRTIPFPVIVAYSGLISLPEQPKRKASSLICQPMVSHSPVCKLHTQRINSLKSSIICTAPNQLFSLIVSRHTRLTIWCRRGFWNAFLSTVTKAETKTKCWMQNESPRCTILCGAFFLILSWDLFVPVHLMLLVLS